MRNTFRKTQAAKAAVAFEGDRLWFKDAIIYQVHVRAFNDSDGDGIGDFAGLAQRLDYLKELGVNAIWLLPFYPSPLRDDGYDIADYTGVHPAYGTLADFKLFLREAHARSLRVITELVINHTSDQHPWFQRARRSSPGSPARDFYVWSDRLTKYAAARIIFKDFEASNWTWDPVAGAYYWHRFYSHQPDLNFETPEVRKAILKAMDFWLGLGVDGLRLDAVPYLHEREGTGCENLPETHAELRALRAHVDRHYEGRMLLAEANQWPEDAAAYFGDGDECHMAFHFPLMPRMFMAVRMEDRYPIIDIMSQTPAIPDTCQWAVFLRNHDELTLEMVTDEERDYMYRVYAHDPQARINLGIRRRLAPLLGNDRRRIELLNALLLSLPGTPVLYYGDEIGMGDNIYLGDRNGVRTPMQWSADRNAGFSRANPQRLFLPVVIDPPYSYESVNVESERDNPHSLLWWVRRMIALRSHFRAFGRGSIEFLYPSNRKVLAFVRHYEQERLLIVANLSRHVQYVELDLAEFKGLVPVELLGQSPFPCIGDEQYLLTLGPHAFYWFALEARDEFGMDRPADGGDVPLARIVVKGSWENVFKGRARTGLEAALPNFLRTRRWFGGKARRIKSASIADVIPIPQDAPIAHILLVRVEYREGDPEQYVMTLAHALGERAIQVRETLPRAVATNLVVDGEEGLLYGAIWERGFGRSLLQAFAKRRRFKGSSGELVAQPSRAFRALVGPEPDALEPAVLAGEQSNTSLRYGDRLILKLFRRAEGGVNPDLEITSFLNQAGFAHVPAVAGSLEYRPDRGEAVTLGILQAFVPNEGDAWQFTMDSVGRYFERVMSLPPEQATPPAPEEDPLDLADGEAPQLAQELVATYLESARLLGQRTAELHLALAAVDSPSFTPEPFTPFYQRSLYQSMRNLTEEVFDLLGRKLPDLPDPLRDEANRLLGSKPAVLRRFRSIADSRITAMRTRFHGDFHLGQVLWTGRDFVIFDFEGEPARLLSTRRIKRSPLRDVAGMIRSFHYAAYAGLRDLIARGLASPDSVDQLEPWAAYWRAWASSAFLKAYLKEAGRAVFVPQDRAELHMLLGIYLLEKAVYELGYELNNRPDWVSLPLHGIVRMLDQPHAA
jgi:maltose alpha-D-glucosyltransferase / alpha-amylase